MKIAKRELLNPEKKLVFNFLAFLVILLTPLFFARAGVFINEIMYDLKDGSDTGREWVEIFNNGSESIDLTGWKFFEANTNHALTPVQGGSVIQPNGFVVIVDNSEKFLTDWPGFSGIIFDSSFSLSNTGEQIILRNSELADIDSVSYNSENGANGDGNSLQKIDGSWKSASPTLGVINIGGSGTQQSTSTSGVDVSEPTSGVGSVSWPVEPQIYANAGEDKTSVAGADIKFSGQALGLKKEPLENARYLWSFGDGSMKEGQNVLHSYKYPAEYIITLDVSSGKYSVSDRAIAKIIPNKLTITEATSEFIKLKNGSNVTLDVSGWFLKSGQTLFKFPESTFIKAGAEIPISSSISGLIGINANSEIMLLYSNGSMACMYKDKMELAETKKEKPEEKNQQKSQVSVSEPLSNDSLNIQETANVADTTQNNSWSKKEWLFLILGIGFIGGAGTVFLRRNSSEEKNK